MRGLNEIHHVLVKVSEIMMLKEIAKEREICSTVQGVTMNVIPKCMNTIVNTTASLILTSARWVMIVIVQTVIRNGRYLIVEIKETVLMWHHMEIETESLMRKEETDLISKETTEQMKAGLMKEAIETIILIGKIKDIKWILSHIPGVIILGKYTYQSIGKHNFQYNKGRRLE